jgi:Gas vesicle synthesis protein GvpL/GvpF
LPDSALYLYCVVPAPAAPPTLRAAALNGAAVHAVRYQDLAVLTHACRPEPYQGTAEDVRGWVAAHNAVVEEAWAAAGSVLPMSFDVIVSGGHGRSAEANLTCWLGEHHAAIRGRLQALDGRAEVGVQVLWAAVGAAAPGRADAASPARGREFFARQRQRRLAREKFEHQVGEGRRRYLRDLATLADEVHVNGLKPAQGRVMVLNVSLLVAKAAIPRVGSYLDGAGQEPGVEVRFTGPWPPYSFAGSFGRIEHGDEESGTSDGRPAVRPAGPMWPINNGGA